MILSAKFNTNGDEFDNTSKGKSINTSLIMWQTGLTHKIQLKYIGVLDERTGNLPCSPQKTPSQITKPPSNNNKKAYLSSK